VDAILIETADKTPAGYNLVVFHLAWSSAMSAEALIEEARKLSVAERIRIAEELWDSLSEEHLDFPLTSQQRDELETRLADYEAHPEAGSSWEDVRVRIERQL
jgi:putative addiction module component (TIGR02574 family)